MFTVKGLTKGLLVILPVLALSLIQPVAGYTKDSENVSLQSSIVINGSQVDPGRYEIKWASNSPTAVMTVLKGGKVVVEARGKFVEKGAKAEETVITTQQDGSGRSVLKEIQFRGRTQAIVFE
jgi:hypothetical protein